ncbi:MAG: EF-hand domain-containing protein [Isosphaeraceae bacterium]|nr:EF-hand domain-containing protein [Isosphaeraceae bacterium]
MMRRSLIFGVIFLGLGVSFVAAQRPGGGRGQAQNSADVDTFVEQMLAFDKDKDGKIAKAEMTDERLGRLFDRADANKDGVVTKEELTALAARESANNRRGEPGFGPPPPGGPMPFGAPGQVLPAPLQQRLGLSADQRSRVQRLQKDVDSKLNEILNPEQQAQLRQLRERGPRGFGPPGGGPPGGGPPGGGRPE